MNYIDSENEPIKEKNHWEKYKIYYLTLGSSFFISLLILASNSQTNARIRKMEQRLELLPNSRHPSSLSNLDLITPQKKEQDEKWLDNQIFQTSLRENLQNKINYFKNIKPYLTEKATNINRNILFYGPPGTGKSYYAELFAKNESSGYFIVKAGELQRIYVGSGGGKWEDVFNKAKLAAQKLEAGAKPIMIIVDEFDSLGAKGKNDTIHRRDDTLINTFLTSMDELHNQNLNIAVLATTNYLDMLEDAAIRAGRFDNKIEVGYPHTKEEYKELCNHLKKQVELEFKNNSNKSFWGNNKSEDKVIEFTSDFWDNIEQKVWEEIDKSEEFKKNSGFDLLNLKVMVRNCIAKSINDTSQQISIGNNEVAKFTEQLKEEIKNKEKTKKEEEEKKKKHWEEFAEALRKGFTPTPPSP